MISKNKIKYLKSLEMKSIDRLSLCLWLKVPRLLAIC